MAKYNWQSAEEYWYSTRAYSLIDDPAFAKMEFKSKSWPLPPKAQEKLHSLFQNAKSEVQAFHRADPEGDEREERRKAVFTLCADAMNEIERWTDYRFTPDKA